ncbi:hypothetical protein AIOL_002366 [Candidatus Rhodobacter oscarellae]|uniref:BioF2-like acetyltransferase domain-containing protein n=1 Tax=Candidatus Rhodobacter oscarellae TaxID=1675527 RepID=A0A0J9GUZ9_9RHOB|nr:GNAT family N-acetyltransferase [Candidatus Rhodobacter lobularis]KMW57403.1 hypothetical protein AIOL_002366 [Candidatus Rhodobacter lobularis]
MSTPNVQIRRFEHGADDATWNAFVAGASNATFLHDRRFMDYHRNRFEDHSMLFEADGKLVALLPANLSGKTLNSHGGLTYGGLLVAPNTKASTVLDVIEALEHDMRTRGIEQLIYKPSPHIFHAQPAEADIYALVTSGAQLVRSDLGSAIPVPRRLPMSGGRKDGIRKARRAGISVSESKDLASFWDILTEVLDTRHGATATHSLDEIILLQSSFPDQIRLFAGFNGEQMLGGALIFDCGTAVHTQYMANSLAGRDLGALDLVIETLLSDVYADRDWFSFGISTTDRGRTVNHGLARQKEMFGARSIAFQQYEWDIR